MPARTQPLLQCRVDAGLPAVACGAKLLHHIVRKADGDAFLGGGSLRSAHAQFALQAVSWADLPEDIQRRAALVLLDDFAAMVAARDEPELIGLRAGVARSAGPAEATVFDGGTRRLDRYAAALSNGRPRSRRFRSLFSGS